MICDPCRQRHHDDCPGGTWCDCQHRPVGTEHDADELRELAKRVDEAVRT